MKQGRKVRPWLAFLSVANKFSNNECIYVLHHQWYADEPI